MNQRYRGALRAHPQSGAIAVTDAPPRRRGPNLRRQFVQLVAVSIVLPVALVGAVEFFVLEYHLEVIELSFKQSRKALARDIPRSDVMSQAGDVARQLDAFFVERIVEAKAWAASEVVTDAARAAHEAHVREGLVDTPIAAIEERFETAKSLGEWAEAATYLRQQVVASPYFAEVFFTDRNGFNVALTNPTSDFVQSDEEWWHNAWSHHIAVGEVQYDESAGYWSLDIAVRIDEPTTGHPLGVLKSVLTIEPVQRIADRTAETLSGGRVIIATGGGALIAETSSGHAKERIMNPDLNLVEHSVPLIRAAFGDARAGFATDETWLTGYARTGGRETYAPVIQRFAGFDWLVILQRPVAGVLDHISALREIENALRGWRVTLVVALAVMAFAIVVFAVLLVGGHARRLSESVNVVRRMAERAVQGEQVGRVAIDRPEELAQLNESVHRLCQVFTADLRRNESGSATTDG